MALSFGRCAVFTSCVEGGGGWLSWNLLEVEEVEREVAGRCEDGGSCRNLVQQPRRNPPWFHGRNTRRATLNLTVRVQTVRLLFDCRRRHVRIDDRNGQNFFDRQAPGVRTLNANTVGILGGVVEDFIRQQLVAIEGERSVIRIALTRRERVAVCVADVLVSRRERAD